MKKYFAKIPIGLIGLLVAALLDGFLLSWRETRALQTRAVNSGPGRHLAGSSTTRLR